MEELDGYQEAAGRTARYPEAGECSLVALSYVILGLVGEAGEIANKVKKIYRDDDMEIAAAHQEILINELGDVLWYVARTASELDVDLSTVASLNLAKLAVRARDGKIGGSGDDR